MIHFHIQNEGTVLLLRPLTESAREWVAENISEHQEFAGAVVVEHRYISDIMQGIVDEGMGYAFR